MVERLITVRESSKLLGLSEKEVIDLVEQGKIPAYKLAGEFLRFREDQIRELKKQLNLSPAGEKFSFREKLADFLYFNDFYLFSLILIALIIFFIFKQ